MHLQPNCKLHQKCCFFLPKHGYDSTRMQRFCLQLQRRFGNTSIAFADSSPAWFAQLQSFSYVKHAGGYGTEDSVVFCSKNRRSHFRPVAAVTEHISWCRKRALMTYLKHNLTQNGNFHTSGRTFNQDEDTPENEVIDRHFNNASKTGEEASGSIETDALAEEALESTDVKQSMLLNATNELQVQEQNAVDMHDFQGKDLTLNFHQDMYSNENQLKEYLECSGMNFKTGYTCHYTVCPKLGKLAMNKLKENDRLYINATSGTYSSLNFVLHPKVFVYIEK